VLEARNSLLVWADVTKDKTSSLGEWVTYDRSSSARTPSQRVFRATLDGKRLGWVDEHSSELHVRAARGKGKDVVVETVWHNDWRFSGDGKRVAAITGIVADETALVVVDLETGKRTDLGHVSSPDRVEWTRDGVVVHEWDDGHDRLTYVPLEGERRVLVSGKNVMRFATAWDGTAVYYARSWKGRTRISSVDVAGGKPVDLDKVAGSVTNGEVAPDGSRAAFSTDKGVYEIKDGKISRVSTAESVRSLWFSPDGKRLAFASLEQVTVREGEQTFTLDHGEDYFISARFVDAGDKILLAAGKHVTRWDPVAGTNETLATATKERTFLAADQLGQSLVVWAIETI
jgi:hypothetical protein